MSEMPAQMPFNKFISDFIKLYNELVKPVAGDLSEESTPKELSDALGTALYILATPTRYPMPYDEAGRMYTELAHLSSNARLVEIPEGLNAIFATMKKYFEVARELEQLRTHLR